MLLLVRRMVLSKALGERVMVPKGHTPKGRPNRCDRPTTTELLMIRRSTRPRTPMVSSLAMSAARHLFRRCATILGPGARACCAPAAPLIYSAAANS
jgi:hypothetical protein